MGALRVFRVVLGHEILAGCGGGPGVIATSVVVDGGLVALPMLQGGPGFWEISGARGMFRPAPGRASTCEEWRFV